MSLPTEDTGAFLTATTVAGGVENAPRGCGMKYLCYGHGHRFATSLSALQPVALPLCLRDAVKNIRVGLVPPSLPATPASKGVGLLFDSEPSVAAPHRGPDETMTMAFATNLTKHEKRAPRVNEILAEIDDTALGHFMAAFLAGITTIP